MDIVYNALFSRRNNQAELPPLSPREEAVLVAANIPEEMAIEPVHEQVPDHENPDKFHCRRCRKYGWRKNHARHKKACYKPLVWCVVCYGGPLNPDDWYINSACGHGVYCAKCVGQLGGIRSPANRRLHACPQCNGRGH